MARPYGIILLRGSEWVRGMQLRRRSERHGCTTTYHRSPRVL